MSIFSKIFKKRQHPMPSDNFEVILKTKKNLSEEQKNAIITIVKDGILSGERTCDIAINIMMSTEIVYDMIILNRIKNGVEVMF